jgi:hypothetical protein
MRRLFIILSIGLVLPLAAQKQKKDDIAAIKEMCGCFEVTFNFAETFSPQENYEFKDNYIATGLEYVLPVVDEKDKIVLQHLLIVNDTMIIKHWRQDWIYENTDLYVFDEGNTWKYESLSKEAAKGQWTQKVYQVDDGPRYEGSATWFHADGRHFWENTTTAPLPRREFSKRSDYNIMLRRNRQEITKEGWVHEQDNDKVLKEDGSETLIAQEKGLNTYKKTATERCQLAQDWWDEKEQYWADVRTVWDNLFAAQTDLTFKKKVDDKPLFSHLFALQDELLASDSYDSNEAQEKIAGKIKMYLETDVKLLAGK